MRGAATLALLAALFAGAASARAQETNGQAEAEDLDLDEEWEAAGDADQEVQENVSAAQSVSHPERDERPQRPAPARLFGYVDLGFFVGLGNAGEGVRRDVGHLVFPEHSDVAWVFYGDLLATQVNSRGDPADLGDLPGTERSDTIDSNGEAAFLVNEVNLSVAAALGSSVLVTASANLAPRRGRELAPGDWLDVDLAQLEWIASPNLSLFAGKVDSVLGHEYKTRKASQRFGITPTLVHRYTSGTAIGLKARGFLLGDHLRFAAALTNGSFGVEHFHFHDELDRNSAKTGSTRVAAHIPLGRATLEVGGSAQVGTQDGAPDGTGLMWLIGADLELSTVAFGLRAQWLRGRAPGDEMARAYQLDLQTGGYVEVSWLPSYLLGVLVRAELRDADMRLGDERLYITRSYRAVAGLRLVLSPSIVLKAEYIHNGEHGDVPSFANDVFTTSMVAVY